MKKLASAFLVVMFMSVLCAYADISDQGKGYISVNSSSNQEIEPNQAEISIGIDTFDKSLKIASEKNKTIANNVYSSLKSCLGAGDYVKTGEYSVRAQYVYKDNTKIFDKYAVSNVVVVRTKNIQLVSKLIDTAIAKGATGIDNLSFKATNYDDVCNDMLAKLSKTAYSQANSVAKSLNTSITSIKSISTSCSMENNNYPIYYRAMGATDASNASTPISGGKLKLNSSIDASFYVK